MKKLIIVALLLLSGCAFFDTQKANWEACKADIECFENAKSWQDKTENLSTIVASAVPIPGAASAPKVIGWGAFAISMLLGGAALRKKKNAV